MKKQAENKLREALALVFVLTDASLIELHHGDRQPGNIVSRTDILGPRPRPSRKGGA